MAEEKVSHNTECQSDSHTEHLCYMTSQGFHLSDKQDYDVLVKHPKFKCEHCGRVANSDTSLCRPVSL
jgi:hypothetical protein